MKEAVREKAEQHPRGQKPTVTTTTNSRKVFLVDKKKSFTNKLFAVFPQKKKRFEYLHEHRLCKWMNEMWVASKAIVAVCFLSRS